MQRFLAVVLCFAIVSLSLGQQIVTFEHYKINKTRTYLDLPAQVQYVDTKTQRIRIQTFDTFLQTYINTYFTSGDKYLYRVANISSSLECEKFPAPYKTIDTYTLFFKAKTFNFSKKTSFKGVDCNEFVGDDERSFLEDAQTNYPVAYLVKSKATIVVNSFTTKFDDSELDMPIEKSKCEYGLAGRASRRFGNFLRWKQQEIDTIFK